MQRIFRVLGHIPLTSITLEHVRSATLVRLPFHLSTGPLFQFCEPSGEPLEVWLRNRITNPNAGANHEALVGNRIFEAMRNAPETLLTDALIISQPPNLRPDEFEALKAGDTAKIGPASFANPGFALLNEIVAAHQMVRLGPYVSGLGGGWPRMLTEREIFEDILVEVLLVSNPEVTINGTIVRKLLQDIDRLSLQLSATLIGDLNDYSPEQLGELRGAVIKVRAHAFYELKTNAISAMLTGNSIVAIVLGCAALEGAHGAYLALALKPNFTGSAAEFNRFVSGLLREQGFFSLVQLSVREILAQSQRPSDNDLAACLEGVTIRNAIMHAGRRKSGKYKLREYSNEEINTGYSGIMAVYRVFEAAVETLEQT